MHFLIYPHLILLAILSITIAADPLKCIPYEFDDPSSFNDVFKVDQIDPLVIGTFVVNHKDVAIVVDDLVFTGFSNAILDEFHIDFKTNLTRTVFHSDVIVKCLFKINGTLFSISVDGHGPFLGIFNKLYVEMVMPFDIEEDFIKLRSHYSSYDIRGNGELQFADFYNGYQKRNETIHNLINHNYRIFILRIGEPFFMQAIDGIFNIFKHYLQSLPLSTFPC